MESKEKSVFQTIYRMVIVDGDVSQKELEVLYKIGVEDYNLTQEELQQCLFSQSETDGDPVTDVEKVRLLYYLALVAWADGKVEDCERSLIESYVIKFGYPIDNSKQIADYFLGCVENGKNFSDILNDLN
ncbi:MAG: TerB family tellurite resistance protein [Paludibacteraceae bacterium]|nr:TerB family tellurite resistance protein [Paludibacteraceae bacterium]